MPASIKLDGVGAVSVRAMAGSPVSDFSFWRRHHAHTAHNAGDCTGPVGESVASGERPTHANTFDATAVADDAGAVGVLAGAGCGARKADCGVSVRAVDAGGGGTARCTAASLTAASLTTGLVGGVASTGDNASLCAADGWSATLLGRAVVSNDNRFGFLWVGAGVGDDQSVPDLLTGVVSLGAVVGSVARVAGAVVASGPESAPAEESPMPNVDVWAPPELLTTTFGPESLTVDEDSDDESVDNTDESSVEPSEPVAVDPVVSGVESVAGVDADVSDDDADEDVNADDESADELDEADESEELESGSAHATPGVVATAMPTPSATANPPTRPMYFALPILWFLPFCVGI